MAPGWPTRSTATATLRYYPRSPHDLAYLSFRWSLPGPTLIQSAAHIRASHSVTPASRQVPAWDKLLPGTSSCSAVQLSNTQAHDGLRTALDLTRIDSLQFSSSSSKEGQRRSHQSHQDYYRERLLLHPMPASQPLPMPDALSQKLEPVGYSPRRRHYFFRSSSAWVAIASFACPSISSAECPANANAVVPRYRVRLDHN